MLSLDLFIINVFSYHKKRLNTDWTSVQLNRGF